MTSEGRDKVSEQIPVNTPMCDRCGKNFLECRCDQIHAIVTSEGKSEKEAKT